MSDCRSDDVRGSSYCTLGFSTIAEDRGGDGLYIGICFLVETRWDKSLSKLEVGSNCSVHSGNEQDSAVFCINLV